MIPLKIAYDYYMTLEDSTQDVNPIKEQVQNHAKKQVDARHCVFFLVTPEYKTKPENIHRIYNTAEKIGVPRENVLFIGPNSKVQIIQEYKIDIVLEDDVSALTLIKMATTAFCVSVYSRYNEDVNWETKMDSHILALQKFYNRNVHLGSDHGGYEVKTKIYELLQTKLKLIHDYGCEDASSCDYPDYAHEVANQLKDNPEDVGILFCSTGQGMAIAANKHQHIRAAVCWTPEIARLAREHNGANVLCVPSKHLSEHEIEDIVHVFLTTDFEGGRHERRVNKIGLTQNN